MQYIRQSRIDRSGGPHPRGPSSRKHRQRSNTRLSIDRVRSAGSRNNTGFEAHVVQGCSCATPEWRVCVCVCVCVWVCHPCNKGLSTVLVYRRGVQHLWHTARNEAIAKGGKGSRALDPVPAKSCSWVTEWQLGNSTESRQSKAARRKSRHRPK